MNLDNYVDVPTRHRQALERWPDLRVVESAPRIVTVDGQTFIEVTMTVHRDPDDPIPTAGTAWEPFPGRTPYTKGSEMMNASTSALGRALGLMGFGISSSMASAEEVRNRRAEQEPDKPTEARKRPSKPPTASEAPDGAQPPKLASQPQLAKMNVLLMELGIMDRTEKLAKVVGIIGRPVDSSTNMTVAEASQVIDILDKEAINKRAADELAAMIPGGNQ